MPRKNIQDAAIIAALGASSTKKEAAARLGLNPATVRTKCESIGGGAWELWQSLPADGAFSGRSASLPKPCRSQSKADDLLAEAVEDVPPDPERSQCENVVGLLWAMFAVHGSMNFPRGWVRAFVLSLGDAGCHPPTPSVARWYRTKLLTDPGQFADHCPDPRLVEDLLAR